MKSARTSIYVLLCCMGFSMGITISNSGSVRETASSSTIRIKLQFDGCLRPPRDPGFPTITHRMAACAASVGIAMDDPVVNICEEDSLFFTPLAVGSRELAIAPETTSQHAEYEGLLLGLEWLVEFCSHPERIVSSLPVRRNSTVPSPFIKKRSPHHKIQISIEGDCKTVIDQVSGRAIPRKLESLHKRSLVLLESLSDHLETTDTQFEIEYRHIPRNKNPISDALCTNLLSIIYAKSWMNNIRKLEEVKPSTQNTSSSVTPPLSDLLQIAIKTTKHSLRPSLYRMVSSYAIELENYKLLIEIGEHLVAEGSLNTKPSGSKTYENSSDSLKRLGIRFQIHGWRGSRNEKKARFLERRYRVLLGPKSNNNKPNLSVAHCENDDDVVFSIGQGERLRHLGDVTEGDWDTTVPKVWRPILERWFFSARYEAESKDHLWIEDVKIR